MINEFGRELFPQSCPLNWSRLHYYLMKRRIQKTRRPLDERKGALDVVLAPRGAAKSTLVSLVFPLHASLYETERYILLIGATKRQACQRLQNLRAALHRNARQLADLEYPAKLSGINTQAICELNQLRIEACSAGTELRGLIHRDWRPTWIILDDVERSERVRSARQRDLLADWFVEVIENLGGPYTNIDLVGTLLHDDALPHRLAKRPDVRFHRFAAIRCDAADETRWARWRELLHDLADPRRLVTARAFFDANREAMLAGAEVLWPEREDYYELRLLREKIGPHAFDKEKQNAPWLDDADLFRAARLRRFRLESKRLFPEPTSGDVEGVTPSVALRDLRIFGFLDPALGREQGDFAAIATVGVDASGYIFVLDVWLGRAAPSEQVPRIYELHARWNYDLFGMEANGFQAVLRNPIEAERRRRRARGETWDVKIIEVSHVHRKQERILRLEPRVSSGWILFSTGLSDEFLRQLEAFPNGEHDDGPDALAAAIELARAHQSRLESALHLPRRPGGKGKEY